jgi:DNA-binding MarR family transcriptional regulator
MDVETLDPMATAEAPRAASTDDFLELAQAIVRGLRSADLDSWCAVDLTMSQLKTLFLARPSQGASHGEIARGLGVGVSTVTGVVDRLVEHGLVVRRTDPDDRRLSHVVATPRGIELIDQLWGSRGEYLRQLLDRLTPEERDGLRAALEHLNQLISEDGAPRH